MHLVKLHLFFSVHGMFTLPSSPDVFWESNPTNIKSPLFKGNTAITLITQKNPERPNSPNVLPMSQCCWSVGFFDSVNLSVFGGIRENSGIEMEIL